MSLLDLPYIETGRSYVLERYEQLHQWLLYGVVDVKDVKFYNEMNSLNNLILDLKNTLRESPSEEDTDYGVGVGFGIKIVLATMWINHKRASEVNNER